MGAECAGFGELCDHVLGPPGHIRVRESQDQPPAHSQLGVPPPVELPLGPTVMGLVAVGLDPDPEVGIGEIDVNRAGPPDFHLELADRSRITGVGEQSQEPPLQRTVRGYLSMCLGNHAAQRLGSRTPSRSELVEPGENLGDGCRTPAQRGIERELQAGRASTRRPWPGTS
jgi:hypothetical protein